MNEANAVRLELGSQLQQIAVDDVSLTVASGEFLTLGTNQSR